MKNWILCLFTLMSLPTLAQSYDIELIAFKRNLTHEQLLENGLREPPNIDYLHAINLNDETAMKANQVRLLPESSYQLTKEYEALDAHAGFEPLLHLVWQQNDADKTHAPIFRLQAGKLLNSQTLENTDKHHELEGIVQVYTEDTLQLDAQLQLQQISQQEMIKAHSDDELSEEVNSDDDVQIGHLAPIQPEIQIQIFSTYYYINEPRPIALGEIYYIDNPAFGLLIQVRESLSPKEVKAVDTSHSEVESPSRKPDNPSTKENQE